MVFKIVCYYVFRNVCIIIGTVTLIVLFSWALVKGITYIGDLVRWWKNS